MTVHKLSFTGRWASKTNVSTLIYMTVFPCEALLSCTWNENLLEQVGYNFEFFSEDSFLAGKLPAREISGAAQYSVFTYINHFAMNEQESFLPVLVLQHTYGRQSGPLPAPHQMIWNGGTTCLQSNRKDLVDQNNPGSTINYSLVPWEMGCAVAIAITGLLFAAVVLSILRVRDEKRHPDEDQSKRSA